MTRVLVALVLCAGVAAPANAQTKPNVVVILADDMGYSDLGCYGSEIDTPNLDKLAAGGVRFTQFYNCARCCPTRAALLTGLYPHQAGVGHMIEDKGEKFPGYRGDLSPACPTIAEALKPAGYTSYLSGKWHVCRNHDPKASHATWPTRRGFERFYGLLGSVRSYYDPPTLTENETPIRAPEHGYYLTDAITSNAVSFLDAAAKDTRPFFLYVAYTAPHWPQHVPAGDVAKYRDRYKAGWDVIREKRHRKQLGLGIVDKQWMLSPRDAEAPAWADAKHPAWEAERMAVYAAMVERMDRGVGEIVKGLADRKQLDNTLILFLSDNGGCAEDIPPEWKGDKFPANTRDGTATKVGNDPAVTPGPPEVFQSYGLPWANASNTPFRRFKHYTHEGGIATPFIAHWPGRIRPGSTSREVGHVIDILPTCLETAGATFPTEFNGGRPQRPEGVSLLPAFAGKSLSREALYWEHEGSRAVRVGDRKLVAKGPGEKWELYDLRADRTETSDLSGREPDRVKELAAKWEAWAVRCRVLPWPWQPAYERK